MTASRPPWTVVRFSGRRPIFSATRWDGRAASGRIQMTLPRVGPDRRAGFYAGGMTWTAPEVTREPVPRTGDDRTMLVAFLDIHRLRSRCGADSSAEVQCVRFRRPLTAREVVDQVPP